MHDQLIGRTALVTGGASGFGLAITEMFVERGAQVVALDLDVTAGQHLSSRLDEVTFVRGDVRDETDLARAVERTVSVHGGLDVVVSNAGTAGGPRTVADVTPHAFDAAMQLHAMSAILLAKHAGPHLASSPNGSMIVTGSTAGMTAGYGPVLYSVAKAAAIHTVRVITAELGELGVRVNAISPGLVATPLLAKAAGLTAEEAQQRLGDVQAAMTHFQPLPRSGRTRDIAAAAAFLASDDAAWITGVNLPVDGGLATGLLPSMRDAAYAPVWQAMGARPGPA